MKKAQVMESLLFLREPFAVAVATSACAYAIWKGLQLVAVVALLGLLFIIYRTKARYCLDQLVFLFGRTRTAKFKDMEIELADGHPLAASGCVYSEYIRHAQPWVQIMAAQLYGHQIGLILRIYREEEMLRTELKEKDLSDLQWRGLVRADSASLSDSDTIRLTEAGKAFAEALLKLEPSTTQLGSQGSQGK
jgi:hypothetical protein